jgi:LysR family transcriptional regulator, transcriptional activator for bauABCD operon
MIGRVSDIDLRLLRIFVAVVESGGYSLAGARLNAAESTISSHMTELERRLGMRLCERGRSGFKLTKDGEEVYEATRELVADLARYRDRLATLKPALGGTLNIGLPDATLSNTESRLVEAFAAYRKVSPGVALDIQMLNPRDLERKVVEGALHLAIAPEHRRVAGLAYTPLFVERNYLYCAKAHPLFTRDDATITQFDLDAADRISRGYLERFDEAFFSKPASEATVAHIEAAALLILTGLFIGFLPDHYAKTWVTGGQLRAIKPGQILYSAHFNVITRRKAEADMRVSAFVRQLRRHCTSVAESSGFADR